MATSANRRYTRQQNRLKEKINKQFLEMIKGKTPEQIKFSYQIFAGSMLGLIVLGLVYLIKVGFGL